MKTADMTFPVGAGSVAAPVAERGVRRRRWRLGIGVAGWGLLGVAGLGVTLAVLWERVAALGVQLATATSEIGESLEGQAALNESVADGISALGSSMRATEQANQSVSNQIGTLSGQIAGLTETLAGEIAQLRRSQQALGENVTSLTEATARHDARFGEVEARLAEAGDGLQKLAAEAESGVAAVRGEVAGQAARVGEIETALADANESFRALGGVLAGLRSDHAAGRSELAVVRERYAGEQAKIAELTTALQAVEAELALALAGPAAPGAGWSAGGWGPELVGPPQPAAPLEVTVP